MEARRVGTLLRPLAESPALVPALLAVGVFVALGVSEGGFLPASWYPVALFLACLLGVALVAIPAPAGAPAALRIAGALLAAFTVWSYLSILWADDQGAALDGANRTLMYAVVFALFAWWPMRGGAGAAVLGAFGLGIAALGLVMLLRAAAADDALPYFVGGRFVDPVGYPNGNVALWFSGVLPCVFLAARREVPWVLRGLGLGGAGLLTGLALLGQSRGWLFTLPMVLILFLAVVPGRARNAVALLAAAAAAVFAVGPVFDVFDGIQAEVAPEPLLDRATRAILLGAAALALLGAVVGYADRRVTVSARASRRLSAAVLVVLVLGAAGGIAGVWAAYGSPVAKAAQAWEDFKSNERPAADRSRFSSALGQNRYDFWRVGIGQFEARPLIGAGVDNFQQDYLMLGRSVERPRYPHSLEVRVLSQTGLVGALLLGGALLAAIAGALRSAWSSPGLAGAASGAALATFLYWAVHGSADWFWELPALGAPAFAMLGLATAVGRPTLPAGAHATGRGRVVLAVGAGCLVAALLVPPWLAYRQIDRALAIWPASPGPAFDRLDSAAALHPLSTQADAAAGAIALRLGRPYLAQERYRRALERNPRSAFVTLQLGALASQLGRPEPARELVERAARLNPRDAITRSAIEALEGGQTLDAGKISADASERASGIAGRE